MVTGFAHVCFNVVDLDRALAFYRDALGFKVAFEFVKDGVRYGVYLKTGPRTFIELFQRQFEPASANASYKHICLEVQDITGTVADLRAKGVKVGDPKLGLDQSWQAWLADPDGNAIELHEYTPKSWQTPALG